MNVNVTIGGKVWVYSVTGKFGYQYLAVCAHHPKVNRDPYVHAFLSSSDAVAFASNLLNLKDSWVGCTFFRDLTTYCLSCRWGSSGRTSLGFSRLDGIKRGQVELEDKDMECVIRLEKSDTDDLAGVLLKWAGSQLIGKVQKGCRL